MNRLLTQLALVSLLTLTVGCASTAPKTTQATGRVEQCLVCAHNRDLACIKVSVDEKTPRCCCNGKTYFFCSDECRKAFEKNPAKYQPHAAAK